MKKLLSLVLVIAMVVCTVPVVFAALEGSGTEADPYKIYTWADFISLENDIAATAGKYYKLMNDIDVGAQIEGTLYGPEGGQREAIAEVPQLGSTDTAFLGTFDGNGHKIHNFAVDNWWGCTNPVGIFSRIAGNAVVKNLAVEDVVMVVRQAPNSSSPTAAMIGRVSENATVTDCYIKNVSTYVTYADSSEFQIMGGMIGNVDSASATVKNCYAIGCNIDNNKINWQSELIGKVTGEATIKNCYAQGHLLRMDNTLTATNLSNNYATEEPINSAGDWWGDSAAYKGTVVTEDTLKTYALTLGKAYHVDSDNINGGFPILAWQGGTAPEEVGVLGSESNPYLITTWAEFQAIDDSDSTGKYYKLMADIDVGSAVGGSAAGPEGAQRNVLELSQMIKGFKGTFDGNGHKLYNFAIDNWWNNAEHMGVFRTLDGNAVVKNLSVQDVLVTVRQAARSSSAGALVGRLEGSATITDCNVKNIYTYVTLTGTTEYKEIGGMIGRITSGSATVRNCYSVGCNIPNSMVSYQADLIGIVAGAAAGVTIENCYADGRLLRVADGTSMNLKNSYATKDAIYPGDGDYSGDDTDYAGTVITEKELRESTVESLGSAFKYAPNLETNAGFPMLAWEAGAADTNAGVVDNSFITGLEGEGTAEAPVLIGSKADWEKFANAVNAAPTKMAAGKYYKLTADIDFENADYTLFIGTEVHPFQATFDGDGHKITNVRIKNTTALNMTYGLFGYVAGDAVIKNVGVENIEHYYSTTTSTVWSQSSFGGLIAVLAGNAKVEYCYSKNVTVDTKRTDNIPDWSSSWATFTGDQISFAGGLIGKTVGGNCVVENCYGLCFEDLSNSSSSTGSIFGGLPEGSFKYIKNCYSDTHIGYCKPADVDKGINCYATKVSGWSAYDAFIGTGATVDELKLAANKLGGAFATDKNNVNGGYPVFAAVRGFDVVTNVVKSGNTITSIDVVKNSAVAGKVIVAAYDSNGFLLTTKVADVPAAGGTVAIGLDATGATVVKAYILKADGEATPTSSINIL